jgi:hypothetical protein
MTGNDDEEPSDDGAAHVRADPVKPAADPPPADGNALVLSAGGWPLQPALLVKRIRPSARFGSPSFAPRWIPTTRATCDLRAAGGKCWCPSALGNGEGCAAPAESPSLRCQAGSRRRAATRRPAPASSGRIGAGRPLERPPRR